MMKHLLNLMFKRPVRMGLPYALVTLFTFLIYTGCGGDNYWEELSSSQNNSPMAVLTPGIHVSGSGSDITGDGSIGNPYRTIFTGLGEAVSRGLTRVYVADGTYTVDDITGPLVFIEGISIFGGFRGDFDAYDPAVYVSQIDNIQTTVGGGALGTPRTSIRAGAGITNTTILSGFTVYGGSGANFVSGIACIGGSPSIFRNIIYGGTPAANQSSYGIIITGTSSPDIHDNDIYGDNPGTGQSYGIYNDSGTPYIHQNAIYAGSGTVSAYGIYNQTISSTIIEGNSINGGTNAANSYAVYNVNSSGITIRYNTINGGTGTSSSYGIYTDTSSPVISYNFIQGGTSPLSYGLYNIGCTLSLLITSNHIAGGAGAPTVTDSRGIFNNSSSPRMFNNTIYGGSSQNNAYGIEFLGASSPEIYNNTINGGDISNAGGTCIGINLSVGNARISNNIIFISSLLGIRTGIRENNPANNPLEIRNNNIFNVTVLYHDADGNGDLVIIGDVNNSTFTTQMLPSTSTGNQDVILSFDTSYRIIGAIPAFNLLLVTGGGLDGAAQVPPWTFIGDKDGSIRAAPWSIGAYEY